MAVHTVPGRVHKTEVQFEIEDEVTESISKMDSYKFYK
jgi:hypothetical protein